DFSNELILQIFPHCHLTTLIAVRGVCSLWRNLLPFAALNLTRLKLLEHYLWVIDSPVFLETRPWAVENLRPFNRQAYLDAILDQHNYIPEEFRLWILEWPARAIVGCAWPGLPNTKPPGVADGVVRREGRNRLGCLPPLVHTVKIKRWETSGPEVNIELPALMMWDYWHKVWLILSDEEAVREKVYVLPHSEYNGDDGFSYFYDSWIEWHESVVRTIEHAA
ncbi:hypothetical protein B0H10DRAFT_1744363, partial [Mycena sp. CBHHK59/15]